MPNRQTIEKHARATWKQFSDGGSVDGESGKKRRVDADPRKQADWSDWLNDRQKFQPSQGSNDAWTWPDYWESDQSSGCNLDDMSDTDYSYNSVASGSTPKAVADKIPGFQRVKLETAESDGIIHQLGICQAFSSPH